MRLLLLSLLLASCAESPPITECVPVGITASCGELSLCFTCWEPTKDGVCPLMGDVDCYLATVPGFTQYEFDCYYLGSIVYDKPDLDSAFYEMHDECTLLEVY